MQLPVPIALLLAALAPTLLAAPTTTPLTTGLDMQKRADEKVVACLAICLTEEHDCVGNMFKSQANGCWTCCAVME